MATTSPGPSRRQWRFTFAAGFACLGIGAGQMIFGNGFGHLDLDLGLGWVVVGVLGLLIATDRKRRWVREQRERTDLPGRASVD